MALCSFLSTMIAIKIKPLSVNQAWQGKRFKTPAYKSYEEELLFKLPALEIPDGNLALTINVAFSNKQSDLDNILKPFLDILQKKYGFNDSRIYQLNVTKLICKKGAEFIGFEFHRA